MKRAVIPAVMAAFVLAAAAWFITRHEAAKCARAETTETQALEPPVRLSQDFIKWIPILATAYAVALVAGAYIVAAAVL